MEPNYKVPTELSVIEYALYFTLVCAVVFLFCQGYEYYFAPFSMNDGIYGSLFFLLTGFHGFHVLVGSILIGIITIRFIVGNFELLNVGTQFQIFKNKSTGFACTLFYWHFVDIRIHEKNKNNKKAYAKDFLSSWSKKAKLKLKRKKQKSRSNKRVLTPKYDNIEYFIEQIEHYKIDDLEYAFLTRAQEAERREEEDEADIYLLDAISRKILDETVFEIDFNHVPEWKVDGYGDFAFYGKDRMVKTKEYPKELPNENERREFELDFLLEKTIRFEKHLQYLIKRKDHYSYKMPAILETGFRVEAGNLLKSRIAQINKNSLKLKEKIIENSQYKIYAYEKAVLKGVGTDIFSVIVGIILLWVFYPYLVLQIPFKIRSFFGYHKDELIEMLVTVSEIPGLEWEFIKELGMSDISQTAIPYFTYMLDCFTKFIASGTWEEWKELAILIAEIY
ncbi:hypothetical protein ACTFIW_000502 (mitochondrion) [Dictyostelium discoideum]